jgi:hypothetical protein
MPRKAKILQLIENNPVLLLSETFGGTPFNMTVGPISVSCSNPNEWALFDLQFDPEQLLIADDEILRDAIYGNVKMIRRISMNAQPPLLPTEFASANIRGGRLPMEIYQERARKVKFELPAEGRSDACRTICRTAAAYLCGAAHL